MLNKDAQSAPARARKTRLKKNLLFALAHIEKAEALKPCSCLSFRLENAVAVGNDGDVLRRYAQLELSKVRTSIDAFFRPYESSLA